MSARTDELDGMTDEEAVASLEEEFPGTRCWRSANGRCFADRPGTPSWRSLFGADWVDLRDELIQAGWRAEANHEPGSTCS